MNGNRSVLFRQIDRETTAMRRVVTEREERKAINRYLLQTTRLARVLIMVLLADAANVSKIYGAESYHMTKP